MKYRIKKLVHNMAWWIAWHLPRHIVYLAAIRVVSYATKTDKFRNVSAPDITAMDAIGCWEK